MKNIVLVVIGLLVGAVTYAQSHTYKMGCRYFKPPIVNGKAVSGEAVCPACAKQKEDELKARVAEDKRRLETEATAQKSKNDKEIADDKSKQEADIKNRQVKEVKIMIDEKNNKKIPSPNKTVKSEMVAGKLYISKKMEYWIFSNIYQYGAQNNALLNSKGDTVKLPFQQYTVYAVPVLTENDIENIKKYGNPFSLEFLNSYPSNTAVIMLLEGMDIINSKGERLLNEKNIFIYHLAKEYFLRIKIPSDYSRGQVERGLGVNSFRVAEASIINSRTKQQIKIPVPGDQTKYGSSELQWPIGPGPTDKSASLSCIREKLPVGWKSCFVFTKGEKVALCYIDHNLNPQIMELTLAERCYTSY